MGKPFKTFCAFLLRRFLAYFRILTFFVFEIFQPPLPLAWLDKSYCCDIWFLPSESARHALMIFVSQGAGLFSPRWSSLSARSPCLTWPLSATPKPQTFPPTLCWFWLLCSRFFNTFCSWGKSLPLYLYFSPCRLSGVCGGSGPIYSPYFPFPFPSTTLGVFCSS